MTNRTHLERLQQRCDGRCSFLRPVGATACLSQDDRKRLVASIGDRSSRRGQVSANPTTTLTNLFPECNEDERCWIRRSGQEERFRNRFKTQKRHDTDDWLWNVDIDRSLRSLERPGIRLYQSIPIDFQTIPQGNVWYDRCEPLQALRFPPDQRRIGFVFNSGPAASPGQHWVCLYWDRDRRRAWYYDSTGKPPYKPIRQFVERLRSKSGGRLHLDWNRQQNQRKDGECGMYCLYMLSGMALGHDFYRLIREAPDDQGMHAIRRAFFATDPDKIARSYQGLMTGGATIRYRYRLSGIGRT